MSDANTYTSYNNNSKEYLVVNKYPVIKNTLLPFFFQQLIPFRTATMFLGTTFLGNGVGYFLRYILIVQGSMRHPSPTEALCGISWNRVEPFEKFWRAEVRITPRLSFRNSAATAAAAGDSLVRAR